MFYSQEFMQNEEYWQKNIRGGENELFVQDKCLKTWFTGKQPSKVEGFSPEKQVLYSLPQPTLDNLTYDVVRNYFDNTWTLTEILFYGLNSEESFYRPPYHHLRHPMIFYYIHVVSFYVNKLLVSGLIQNGINKYFEEIFEVGVDEMSWDDMSKNKMDWPSLLECHEYRKIAYNLIVDIIEKHFDKNIGINVNEDNPLWSLFMGFEHERIHIETSSVLIRELPIRLVSKPKYFAQIYQNENENYDLNLKEYPENELILNNGGKVKLGKDINFPTYGWDNEYGERELTIPSFKASKYKVTNGEFYEFVINGGYDNKDYWCSNGWNWKCFNNKKCPSFWVQDGPGGSYRYKLRYIFEINDLIFSLPVIVNYYEAKAFCNWKSKQLNTKEPLRLICEGEHQLMRNKEHRSEFVTIETDPALNFNGNEMINNDTGYNLNLGYSSETPVNLYKSNNNGYYDIIGNVWEWSEDHFNPLNNFKIHNYYNDFSMPCFDGKHNMIFGGSFISTGDNGANLFSRYHFRPHFLQHSGFRYVEPSVHENGIPGNNIAKHLNMDNPNNLDNVYETKVLVDEYMSLHYGQDIELNNFSIEKHDELSEKILKFPQRCAQLLIKYNKMFNNYNFNRALDIGCAVGGSTFELSKEFNYVLGIDLSNAFINKANEMKNFDTVSYEILKQGNIFSQYEASLLNDFNIRKHNCEFKTGNACNLGTFNDYNGKFDCILMANLLCRLSNPKQTLLSLNNLLNLNGILLLVSPYSWLKEYTLEENWLGGNYNNDNGQEEESFSIINDILNNNGFELLHEENMPLIIRQHQRKYQYILSHAIIYIKTQDME